MAGTMMLARLRSIHAWPFLAPSDTTSRSAPLALMRAMRSSPLSSSIEPCPGDSKPTHTMPLASALSRSAAASATPSGPPKKYTETVGEPRLRS